MPYHGSPLVVGDGINAGYSSRAVTACNPAEVLGSLLLEVSAHEIFHGLCWWLLLE